MIQPEIIQNWDTSKFNKFQLKEYVDALESAKKNKETHQWKYFVPNIAQQNFLEIPKKDLSWIWTFSAGNGVGKTTVLINIICNLINQPENDYFKDIDFYKNFKRPSRGRIVSDPTTIKEKIIKVTKRGPNI